MGRARPVLAAVPGARPAGRGPQTPPDVMARPTVIGGVPG